MARATVPPRGSGPPSRVQYSNASGTDEEICVKEQGPFKPINPKAKSAELPILHSPEEPTRVHPDHIKIRSKSDHTSKLRERRPPTPAPANMGKKVQPDPEDEALEERKNSNHSNTGSGKKTYATVRLAGMSQQQPVIRVSSRSKSASSSKAEQVCEKETGPFKPVDPTTQEADAPILHSPDEPARQHPDHIKIQSKSDHTSKLRERRPPTPAPKNMGRPVQPDPEDESLEERLAASTRTTSPGGSQQMAPPVIHAPSKERRHYGEYFYTPYKTPTRPTSAPFFRPVQPIQTGLIQTGAYNFSGGRCPTCGTYVMSRTTQTKQTGSGPQPNAGGGGSKRGTAIPVRIQR